MNTVNRLEGRTASLGWGLVLWGLVTAGLWGGASHAQAGTGQVRDYFEVGRALVEAGHPQEGLLHVAVAVAVSPSNVAAQTYLLTVLDRDCCRSEVRLHEALHTVLPRYRPLTERLARLHEGQARFEQAGALHLEAADLPPDSAESQRRLAHYYRFVGREDLAREAFSRAQLLGGPDGLPNTAPSVPNAAYAGDAGAPPPRQWRQVSLEPQAETGDPLAMFVTGRKYIVNGTNAGRGDWVERGLGYLERSAGQGYTAARRFLGALYLAGELVPQDVERGVAHYERAAAAGDVIAQKQLGDMYFEGVYMPRNLSRAVYWYQTILFNPNGGPTAYKSEDRWRIELRLARLYLAGEGVERDPVRARELLERAAQGSKAPPALEALGEVFEKGLGGDRRAHHALMWYAAAARGYLERGYQYGLGPDASRREARDILRAMERIEPQARLTRQLRTRLTPTSGTR
jgi:TPR repeat protein